MGRPRCRAHRGDGTGGTGPAGRTRTGIGRIPRLLVRAIAVLVAVYAIAAFVVSPEMYTDSAYGFLVWDSMVRGASFNHWILPDFADIARDQDLFMAVWSPGQYIFAGPLERAGLGLGAAMNIVTTVFTVLGLFGWYRLYRTWNFSAASAVLAIAVTACSRHFALPFGIYNGGEVLLFGGMPWFLLLLGRCATLESRQVIAVLAAFVAVAFLKLSGIVFAFAALAAIVVYDLWPPRGIRWRRPLTATAMLAVFMAALYFFWISRGWTAIEGKGGAAWASLLPRFLEGWAAAVMAMFSLGDLAARVFQRPGQQMLENLDLAYLAASVPALALLVWSGRRLRASHPEYLRFAGATAIFYVAAMALIYARGGDILMEDRFYRPLALVLLVGVVQAVATANAAIRLPLGALAAATMVYGVSSYAVRLQHNLHAPLGSRGFHHGTLTHDGLALLRRELKGADSGTVIWVTMPEIALEARQVRVLVNAGVERELETRTYKGRAVRVLVFVDDRTTSTKGEEIVLKAFVGYERSKWVAARLGDSTVFSQ
jgi:hypothetical protein